MTVRELLVEKRPAFSFEFFPPKTEQGERTLFETVRSMKDLDPAFVSVTCGTGGSSRGKTLQWAGQIKNDVGIEAVVHMTCLGRTREELRDDVAEARSLGIENILALRGDAPRGAHFTPGEGTCRFAIDLIRVVRQEFSEACVLGACYPEGHTDAESRDMDMVRLREKCDAGLDVLITQLFFDNSHYFSFVERARGRGDRAADRAGDHAGHRRLAGGPLHQDVRRDDAAFARVPPRRRADEGRRREGRR